MLSEVSVGDVPENYQCLSFYRRTGGFGLPPRLANRNAAGGETLGGARRVRRRRRDGGGGLGGGGDGDVGSRGRALKVGEDLRLAITRGNVDEVRRIFDGGKLDIPLVNSYDDVIGM